MNMKKTIIVIITTVAFVAMATRDVSAFQFDFTPSTPIYKKVVEQNLKDCVATQPAQNEVLHSTYAQDSWKTVRGFKSLWTNNTSVHMPNGYTNIDNDTIGCRDFVFGNNKYNGLSDIYATTIGYGPDIPIGLEKKEALLTGLGYRVKEQSDVPNVWPQRYYYTLKYLNTDTTHYTKTSSDQSVQFGCELAKLLGLESDCDRTTTTGPYDASALVTEAYVRADGTVDTSKGIKIYDSGHGQTIDVGITYNSNTKKLIVKCEDFWNTTGARIFLTIITLGGTTGEVIGGNCVSGSMTITDTTQWSKSGNAGIVEWTNAGTVVGFLNTHLPIDFSRSGTYTNTFGGGGSPTITTTTTITTKSKVTGTISNDPGFVDNPNNTVIPGTFIRQSDFAMRYKNAVNYFVGANLTGVGGMERSFTSPEVHLLYTAYLVDFYGVQFECGEDAAIYYDGRDGYYKVKNILYDNELKTCYVKPTKNEDASVYGTSYSDSDWGGGRRVFRGTITLSQLASEMSALSVTAEEVAASNISSNPNDPINPNVESEPSCYDGAASLGWVLCPLLETFANVANDIYDEVIGPELRMNVELLDSGSETFNAWRIFQAIANLVFIIFFIVVIGSQITGIGISNYGIKKALPKLIIAAIMVNLSFIVCQLAVDVSNIGGASLKAMFDGFANQVRTNDITGLSYGGTTHTMTQPIKGYTGTGQAVSTIVALVIPLITAYTIYSEGFAIIIPLLIGVFSVAIAIITVFILLSLRKAAVVVLTVLSPLAFVTYMLPNTKKLFDKWLKALEGMLLLYPIASLLVGGGNFVSQLLLSTQAGNTSFFYALSAMIIGVVPIFFIPSLLKGSFAAMGNIGAKVSGLTKSGRNKVVGWGKPRLEDTGLNNRHNYHQMQLQQKVRARQGAYNAERSRGVLKRMSKISPDDMNARRTVKYMTAQRMVDSEERDRQEVENGKQASYEREFSTMSTGDIQERIDKMGESGVFDQSMTLAAISQLGQKNQGDMLSMLNKLSTSKSWQSMSGAQRARVASALAAQNGNAVAQSYGKVLNTAPGNVSLKEAITGRSADGAEAKIGDRSIPERISGMDTNALAQQDKDTLNWMANSVNTGGVNMAQNAFTASQTAEALASSDGDSDKSRALSDFVSQRSDVKEIVDKTMTDEQISRLRHGTIHRMNGDRDEIMKRASARAQQAAKNPTLSGRIDPKLAPTKVKVTRKPISS